MHDRGEASMTKLQRLGGVTFHHAGAFWFGVVAVTAGVIAHIPMYLMGSNMGYRLGGMPMDVPMMVGMAAIVVGLAARFYPLLPPPPKVSAPPLSPLPVP